MTFEQIWVKNTQINIIHKMEYSIPYGIFVIVIKHVIRFTKKSIMNGFELNPLKKQVS